MKHARPDYSHIQDTTGHIPEDEPVFLIRAKDIVSGDAVRAWADLAEEAGAAQNILVAAREQAKRMDDWVIKSVPDLARAVAELHCYADDGTDWVIAHSPEDADAAWRETTGDDHTDDDNGAWVLCDPESVLRVDLDDGRGHHAQPIREWIAECGRGFLCSENY